MASASSTANNLTFELTNQLQDMQSAGVRGATNAIPMISEQFLRLQDQAGSTTGALSQMLSTFTGPTGILAIGTLGLQALPSVIDFFSGVREEAEKTAEEVGSLKEATDQLITGFESKLPDFQIADAGQARRSVEGLEQSIQSREQLLEDLREALEATGAEQAQLSRGAARFAQLEDSAIRQLIQRNEQQIRQERALSRSISERLGSREEEVDQAELLKSTQGIVVDQNEDAAEATQKELQALQEIQRISAATDGTMQQDRVGAVLADPRRDLRANLRQNIQDSRLVGSDRELGRRPIGSSPSAQGLQAARAAGIIDEFQKFPELLDSMEKEQKQTFGQGIQLAAQLGTTLDQAFEQGIDSAEEFAKTVLPLLGQIIGTIAGGPAGGAIGGAAGQIAALPFAEGGPVRGEGGTTEDHIPAWLSHREFVVQAESAMQAPTVLRAMNDNPAVAQMVEGMIAGRAGLGEVATTSNAPMIVHNG
jgi:hypothetical protein